MTLPLVVLWRSNFEYRSYCSLVMADLAVTGYWGSLMTVKSALSSSQSERASTTVFFTTSLKSPSTLFLETRLPSFARTIMICTIGMTSCLGDGVAEGFDPLLHVRHALLVQWQACHDVLHNATLELEEGLRYVDAAKL